MVYRRRNDRRFRLSLAVQPQQSRQVHVREHVAVEDDDRIGQRIPRVPDRAAGPERDWLDDVADAHAKPLAVPEDLLDAPRLVVEAQNHLVDLGHPPQQIDCIEKRPVEDGDDRFGVWTVSGLRRVPLPPASRIASCQLR